MQETLETFKFHQKLFERDRLELKLLFLIQ